MEMRFTAWITTARDCLEGDSADVVVLADAPAGVAIDDNGNEATQWSSSGGDPLLHAELGIHHLADIDEITGRAEQVLLDNRWQVVEAWAPVPTGVAATVEFNLNTGDRVTCDSGPGELGDIGVEVAVVHGDDGEIYHIPVDEIAPLFDQ